MSFDGNTISIQPLMICDMIDLPDKSSKKYSYFGGEYTDTEDEKSKEYSAYITSLTKRYIYNEGEEVCFEPEEDCRNIAALIEGFYQLNSDDNFSGYSEDTQKYLNTLMSDNDFLSGFNRAIGYQILDMNCDGTPEILLKNIRRCMKVYSVDNEGKCVFLPSEEKNTMDHEAYSYSGNYLQPYVENDITIFLTDGLSAKSFSESGGLMKVRIDGDKIISEYIINYECEITQSVDTYEYYYDNKKITKEEYDNIIQTYINSLEKCDVSSEIYKNKDVHRDYVKSIYQLADATEQYFHPR